MINGNTKVACLIGNPVKKSLSPIIHNYLFMKYKQNIVYECFEVYEENLKTAVDAIKTLGIVGCNVTFPYKVKIQKYLDEIDAKASIVGAINTVKNEGGILKGYNTDGFGLIKSIIEKGYSIDGKKVTILGAGGACRSIAIELANFNAKSIDIRNRSLINSKIISEKINNNFATNVIFSSKKITKVDIEKTDILINTTPIGMDSLDCPIDKNINVNCNTIICDIIYHPHETTLIKWAKSCGLSTIFGIDMLINQAIKSFEIWTGIQVDLCKKIKLNELITNKL